jgi:flagellar assembly protein FliH
MIMKAEMVGETPYKKFMFDTDFDELAERREKARAKAAAEAARREVGEAEPEPAPEPEAPTYSEEDLARAREEGLAEGRRLGTEEASSTVDKQIADTLNAIMEKTQSLFETQAEANQELTHHAVSVASALVRKLFPTLNQQTALDQVQSMLEAALGQLSGEAEIIIRVPTDLAEVLHERVEAVSELSGFRGTLKILGDPGLTVGDCRLEWSSGGVKRSAKDLARQLDEIVARNLKTTTPAESDPEPTADAQADARTDAPEEPAAPAPAEAPPALQAAAAEAEAMPTAEGAAMAEAPAADPVAEPLATAPETSAVAEAGAEAAPMEPHPAPESVDDSVSGPPPVPSEELISEIEAAIPAAAIDTEDSHAPVPSEDLVADAAPEGTQDDTPESSEEAAPEPERYGGADLELEDDLKD